jgi:hypothetical protein
MSEPFDLMAWMREEMDRLYAEEVSAKWQDLLFGNRSTETQGFTGLSQLFEGFDPTMSIWGIEEVPSKFTPSEFDKMWNGLNMNRKIEYVLMLIS